MNNSPRVVVRCRTNEDVKSIACQRNALISWTHKEQLILCVVWSDLLHRALPSSVTWQVSIKTYRQRHTRLNIEEGIQETKVNHFKRVRKFFLHISQSRRSHLLLCAEYRLLVWVVLQIAYVPPWSDECVRVQRVDRLVCVFTPHDHTMCSLVPPAHLHPCWWCSRN